MAYWDLYNWGLALSNLLPGYQGIITCTVTTPMECTIQISWVENAIANNAQQVSMSSLARPTYTVDVQP
jgi:hypothetical protein